MFDILMDGCYLCIGKISMSWAGTTPRLIIMDTKLMKEVLSNKLGHFQLPPLNPLILILTRGLTALEGEKWAKHRRIINPAFHQDKLKVLLLAYHLSSIIIFLHVISPF